MQKKTNIISKYMQMQAKAFLEELNKTSKAAMEEQDREKVPNNGSGYRPKEHPTGEEINYIIKFWFRFISDNFKEYNHILETKVAGIEKITAALAATNAAVIIFLVMKKLSRSQ